MAVKGYAAPEVRETYTRALTLGRRLGESPERFRILRGLWNYHLVRAELRTARALAEELLTLATRLGDPGLVRHAHAELGKTLCHLGEIEPGHRHLDAASPPEGAGRPEPNVAAYDSWALWYLGYPDRARARSDEAIALAQALGEPLALAFALGFAAYVRKCRREVDGVLEIAEASLAHCRELQYPYWLAWGLMHRGWALAEQGLHADGLIEIKDGLAAYQETGAEVGLAHFRTLYVEALARAGETLEALRIVDETIDLMGKNDNRWHEAEIYRLKGELLAAVRSKAGEAESWLLRAVEAARRQRALWPELRARMALARRHDAASGDEARADLLAVTGRLTEGRDTADAREAAAILRSR
jgi:hypothetical protein